ncbi:MAG: hypothetical protein ACOCXJ_01820 [Planctomycetota bacterium]
MKEQTGTRRAFAEHLAQAIGDRAGHPVIRQSRYMKGMAEQLGMAAPPTANDYFLSQWASIVAALVAISYQDFGQEPAGIED